MIVIPDGFTFIPRGVLIELNIEGKIRLASCAYPVAKDKEHSDGVGPIDDCANDYQLDHGILRLKIDRIEEGGLSKRSHFR